MLLREEARARGLRVLERDSRSHSGVDGGSEYCERHVARTRVSAVASARTRVWRCPCRSGRPMWCARARRASCDTWQRARHDSETPHWVCALFGLGTCGVRVCALKFSIAPRLSTLRGPRGPRTVVRRDSAHRGAYFYYGFTFFLSLIASRSRRGGVSYVYPPKCILPSIERATPRR